jgi:MarR family transcriptional regulator, 2-MHQ and catechol-resistance regulon repressor
VASAIKTWLVLWRATKAIENYAVQSIEGLGIGLTDFAVLEALLHKGPLPINTLGQAVLLTSGSMTAAVDRLEKQELVERTNDPTDRRARLVNLTAKGSKLIKKAFDRHEADIDKLMASTSKAERKQLTSSLMKLRHAAGTSADRPKRRQNGNA